MQRAPWDGAIMHKDLLPVVYVTGDEAGSSTARCTACSTWSGSSTTSKVGGRTIAQTFITQPADTSDFAIKWDGEWQITYETFRDMGIAYAAGMVLIYLLVVAQFRSYLVPLVIMAPIPLTVIGVMPGHALLGAQFTATSMIGMIALAGIIVRNSILLVDFINQSMAEGRSPEDAVIEACAVRAKPIVLTGAGGDDGRLLHPRRPDLQRPGDLADLRHPGLDRADAGGDPAALLRAVARQGGARPAGMIIDCHGGDSHE